MTAACAEATAARVLEVDETGVAYRFRHTLLREAVRSALLPADRLRWHERWALELDRDDSSPDSEFGRIAAAYHWECTGDAGRAFDATLAAAELARSMGASSERAVLLQRLLRLWPRVRGAGALAHRSRDGCPRRDHRRVGAVRRVGRRSGTGRGDAEDRRRARDARRTALQVRRRWFTQQLGAGDGEEQAELTALLEQLLTTPPDPLTVEALIRLGFDLVAESPALAGRAHRRSVEVAEALGQPRKLFWAESATAMHLALVGRVEDAVADADGVAPSVRARFPAEAGVLDAECAWWLCCLGHYRQAREVGSRALHVIGPPEQARRSWAVATAHTCAALLATGDWDQAARRLDHARTLRVSGTRAAVVDVLAGNARLLPPGRPRDGGRGGGDGPGTAAGGRGPGVARDPWLGAVAARRDRGRSRRRRGGSASAGPAVGDAGSRDRLGCSVATAAPGGSAGSGPGPPWCTASVEVSGRRTLLSVTGAAQMGTLRASNFGST